MNATNGSRKIRSIIISITTLGTKCLVCNAWFSIQHVDLVIRILGHFGTMNTRILLNYRKNLEAGLMPRVWESLLLASFKQDPEPYMGFSIQWWTNLSVFHAHMTSLGWVNHHWWTTHVLTWNTSIEPTNHSDNNAIVTKHNYHHSSFLIKVYNVTHRWYHNRSVLYMPNHYNPK